MLLVLLLPWQAGRSRALCCADDGIDIDSSQNVSPHSTALTLLSYNSADPLACLQVVVRNVNIQTCDDGICFKATDREPHAVIRARCPEDP